MRSRRRTVSLTSTPTSPSPSKTPTTATHRGQRQRRRRRSWGSESNNNDDDDDDHSANSAPAVNNVSDQDHDGGDGQANTTTPQSMVASMSSNDDDGNNKSHATTTATAAVVNGRATTSRSRDDKDDSISVSSSSSSSSSAGGGSSSLPKPPSTRRIHTSSAALMTTNNNDNNHQQPSPLSSWQTFFASPRTTILNRLRQSHSPPSPIHHHTPNRHHKHHLSEHDDTDSYVGYYDDVDDDDDDYEDGLGTADEEEEVEDYDNLYESDTHRDGCSTGYDDEQKQAQQQQQRPRHPPTSSPPREMMTTTKPISRRTSSSGKKKWLLSTNNDPRTTNNDGLHQRRHRSNHHSDLLQVPPASSPYRTHDPPQYRGRLLHPALANKQKQATHPHRNQRHQRHMWFMAPWNQYLGHGNHGLKIVLVLVAMAYVCLVAHVYHRASYEQQHQHNQDAIWVWQYQLEKRRLARSYMDQKQLKALEQLQNQQHQRAQQRQHYTQPTHPSLVSTNTNELLQLLQPYTILRNAHALDPHQQQQHNTHREDVSLLASMEDLCGYYAQNASLSVPSMYSRRDALGITTTTTTTEEDPASLSPPSPPAPTRVLISGILNPLGYHLALTLKERCKVPHLIGIDNMFPNTVSNRLHQLNQLQLVSTHLEGILDKPILYANLGLEPKSGIDRDEAHYLPSGQLDLIQTFRPTHIVHLASYVHQAQRSQDHPSMYSWKASISAMEHILASISATEPESTHRPHFVYLSSRTPNHVDDTANHHPSKNSKLDVLHRAGRKMDEILADTYHAQHQVFSVAVRIPDAIFGPWGHVESPIYQLLDDVVRDNRNNDTTAATAATDNATTSLGESKVLDVVYVGDVVEGLVAAMQFRSPNSTPVAFDFPPVAAVSAADVRVMSAALLRRSEVDLKLPPLDAPGPGVDASASPHPAADWTHKYLQWFPSTSLREGMIRTLAWHLDQQLPYGAPIQQGSNVPSSTAVVSLTGDALMQQQSLSTCSPDDLVCHAGTSFMPCASECSIKSQCLPSVFDSMISLMHEVLEGCDVVLYTQALDIQDELTLETEYMDEGNPLICTLAFVNFESQFVQTVVKKVPDPELVKLGVTPRHEDGGTPEGIHKLKRDKLNGRLLYLGWLLVWPDEVPLRLTHADSNLLKLSPGRLFPPEVKYGVFIEQSFGASPRIDDVYFLMHSMTRPAIPTQIAKSKTVPKTKFRLPPEPPKRAVLLLSELRRQESSKAQRVYSDSKLSIRQASRYMRYELGEAPVGKEPLGIKQQREFYERATTFLNSNAMRSPAEPLYKLELKHLARTRWVVHDMQAEEGRQLRCDWYREHLRWNSPLDQLSLAFVLAQRELHRRMAHDEIDDRIKMSIADQIELKKLLTDVLEWHPLETEVNRHYSPFTDAVEEVRMDSMIETDDTDEETVADSVKQEFMFARIISDRYLSMARKTWNSKNH